MKQSAGRPRVAEDSNMNRPKNMTGPMSTGLRRLAAICLLMSPGLIFGGCVVGNDEFDEAKRQRDQNLTNSKAVVADNDRLNKEIARLYNDCDFLASQLAMVSATNLHNRLTAEIGKPKPVPQPTPPPAATRRPQSGSGDGDSGRRTGRGGGGQQRPSGGGGNTGQRPSGGGGGGSPAPSPSDGSVDWGSISF